MGGRPWTTLQLVRRFLRDRAVEVVDPLDVGETRSPLVGKARVAFHLMLRVVFRVLLAGLSKRRTRSERRRVWWAFWGFLLVDIVEAIRLHRDDRVRSVERAIIDTADLM